MIIFTVIGTIYFLIGSNKMYTSGPSVEAIGWMVTGFFIVVYRIVNFTTTFLTPRVTLDESKITLKNKFFGSRKLVGWSNINSIDFGQYVINFQLKAGGRETFSYRAHPDVSVEIKEAIREIANAKSIDVADG